MNRNGQRCRASVMLFLVLVSLVPGPQAMAQDATQPGEIYQIGTGDVLRINVPQQPSLDGQLTIQANGTAYISNLGEVALAGLTLAEAEELLGRRLRLYYPSINEVVLGVVEYNAMRIFALGALTSPGSYTFETPPSLWEVLRAAGGPGEGANLAACRIITVQDGRPVSRTVNLSGFLSGTEMPTDLLQSGDTLVVPTIADGVVGVAAAQGVQVFGGVATPTTVPIEQPTDLLSVIMLAGSSLENSELHKVNWVHRTGSGQDVAQVVNMKQFLEHGMAKGNPVVSPGDVVYVPQYRQSAFMRVLPIILTTMTTIATLILAYDRIAYDRQ